MRGMRALLLVLAVATAVLVLRAVPAYASHGGVMIPALAIDPLTPTTLYAGTYGGGVFKSTDGGLNWSASGLTSIYTSVTALAIDPVTPTTLYAGSIYWPGVFKSPDGGASWNATGLARGVLSLAIDPLTPTTLYAGDDAGGVFKSMDGGANWSAALLFYYGLCGPCGGVGALTIDPLIQTTLFGGTGVITAYDYDGSFLYTASGRVFKSADGGTGWGMSAWFDDDESVQTLAIEPRTDPQTPATLYAGTTLRVVKSTDGGVSWNATGLTGVPVSSLAIDPLTPTTLYAGTNGGGVFKSTDGGASWNAIGLTGVGGVLILAIDPLTPTTLYAGTGIGGVHKSTNGGLTWNPTGLITWPHDISSVSVNPTSVFGGSPSTGTVTLSAPAPAGGAVVALSADPSNVATVPASVTVTPGATSADFTVSTSLVTGSIAVTISGLYGGVSNSAVLTVTIPSLSSLSLNPPTVTGAAASIGTVTLSAAAPAGGAVVALLSTNPAVATVPANVTVPAGAMGANFTVSTTAVTASTSVTIWAANYSTVLTVTQVPSLSSLSLNPASVTAGTTSSGRVTLTAAAPVGGAVVALASNNTAVATVPTAVTVAAGDTSAIFTVSTNSLAACASSAATISATYGGETRSAGLTVTQSTDTVAIQQADYFAYRHELRVAATSTGSTATLQVYVTPTGDLIGALKHYDGNRYSGRFTWPVNPQNITVRGSLCGSATKAVTLK
jgi:photosystem II stability/assembly factor-like uncharacterized protein